MRTLKEPLGLSGINDSAEFKLRLLKMGIKPINGYVYFNDMLYRCMKMCYGDLLLNNHMVLVEIRTQNTITSTSLT